MKSFLRILMVGVPLGLAFELLPLGWACGMVGLLLLYFAWDLSKNMAMLLMLCVSANATTYYVATTGNDGNPGSLAQPWATLGHATSTVVSGDTILMRGGRYSGQNQAIDSSGRNNITLGNFTGEVPVVSEVTQTSTSGLILEAGTTNWFVYGIMWSNVWCGITLTGVTNTTISNCVVTCAAHVGWGQDDVIYYPPQVAVSASGPAILFFNNSQFNKLLSCTVSNWGAKFAQIDDNWAPHIGGTAFQLGPNSGNNNDFTWYNLIEGCTFARGGHDIMGWTLAGYNVIRSNYFHNEAWELNTYTNSLPHNLWPLVSARIGKPGRQPGDGEPRAYHNVWDWNIFAYSSSPGDLTDSALAWELQEAVGIFRNNVIAWTAHGGIMLYDGASNNCIYANTVFQLGVDSDAQDAYTWATFGNGYYYASIAVVREDTNSKSNHWANNIFWQNFRTHGTWWAAPTLAFPGYQFWPTNWSDNFANTYPQFVNTNGFGDYNRTSNLPDLRLKSTSPCIDVGAFLTKITSASGSGTSFTVDEPLFFSDGNKIVPGDTIQLQYQDASRRTTIQTVDYTTKVITVSPSITWTNGQGVALAYFGSSPDMGAFEFSPFPPVPTAVNAIFTGKHTASGKVLIQ